MAVSPSLGAVAATPLRERFFFTHIRGGGLNRYVWSFHPHGGPTRTGSNLLFVTPSSPFGWAVLPLPPVWSTVVVHRLGWVLTVARPAVNATAVLDEPANYVVQEPANR